MSRAHAVFLVKLVRGFFCLFIFAFLTLQSFRLHIKEPTKLFIRVSFEGVFEPIEDPLENQQEKKQKGGFICFFFFLKKIANLEAFVA